MRLEKLLMIMFLVVAGNAGATETVSFSRDLAPVLKARCAICHLTGQEGGNMKLYPAAAYASIVNISSKESSLLRIRPGAPDQSYLMHKLDGTHLDAGGQGDQMPFGQPPLDETTLNLFRTWIANGAKNN